MKGRDKISPNPGIQFGVTAYPPDGNPYLARELEPIDWKKWRNRSREVDVKLPCGVLGAARSWRKLPTNWSRGSLGSVSCRGREEPEQIGRHSHRVARYPPHRCAGALRNGGINPAQGGF